MLSASKIKFIKSLEHKKFRQESGFFVAEGVKVVEELLLSDFKIEAIYLTSDCKLKNSESVECNIITPKELARISFLKTPNKVLALVKIPEYEFDIKSANNELMLALDNISDPGNMGTIIRVANWYGISTVLCNNNCVDIFNPKVIQSAMGAVFRTKSIYSDLYQTLLNIKNLNNSVIYSAELEGTSLYEIKINNSGIIVIGNESHGISPAISSLSDIKFKIPSFPPENKSMESLNAGVAAGIICGEFRRQFSFL